MMDTLEILAKVKSLADEWEAKRRQVSGAMGVLPEQAYSDFRGLQLSIEKSLDEMADGMLKQEQETKESK